jgi:DNA invertase Pin-like site-specific DNA recombinase
MTTSNAGIYLRVSTDEQNTDLQKDNLTQICKARGWTPVFYEDHGISGSVTERPALDKMMRAAMDKEIQVILAWKLDRLGRSTQHLAGLINDLLSYDCGLCVPSQGIDTTGGTMNPASKLQLNVLAAVAEFERDLIRERTKAGMRAAMDRGVHCGRLTSVTQEQLQLARLVIDSGEVVSVRHLSRTLGLSPGTAWRLWRKVLKEKATTRSQDD